MDDPRRFVRVWVAQLLAAAACVSHVADARRALDETHAGKSGAALSRIALVSTVALQVRIGSDSQATV